MPPSEKLLFLQQGLRDSRVAALFPTLRGTARRILRRLDLRERRVVLEYGPGTGVFTRELLLRLTPDSRLIVIERNAAFVNALRQIADPRLKIIDGNAQDVLPLLDQAGEREEMDYVLSGIPFSTLPSATAEKLVTDTHKCLKPEGSFIVYQITSRVARHLRNVFQGFEKRWVWHMPPYRVFEARKAGRT